jgi:hypothetical protein
MPGFLLTSGNPTMCAHGGQGKPTVVSLRVKVAGQPAVLQPPPYVVAGCPNPPQTGGPCVSAAWTTGALRVRSNGMPVLLVDSRATCAPTGVPLTVTPGQVRVKAQ